VQDGGEDEGQGGSEESVCEELRPVPGHRIGFVSRVCYAENPASHRFGHSGTSAGIWVCDGPKCNSLDIIGFTTLICPIIVASD